MIKKGISMKANDQLPMCSNCKRGKLIPLTNDVICPIHGVVSTNFKCKKYSYNLFLHKPKRKRMLNTADFTQADFSLSDND